MKRLLRCLRHLWLDADDARRALGEDAIGRLEARVSASERTHSGQICLCVEASLPPSELWRHLVRGEAIEDRIRERALTVFGEQRVWDTELNNGVLVYLLLAEHRIEIVADDHDVEQIVETITRAAQTGKVGDGKIWVTPVESVVRVRTGDTGPSAV